jgi:hypothetical protein
VRRPLPVAKALHDVPLADEMNGVGCVGRMIVPAVFSPPLGDHCSNRLNRLPLIVLAFV